MQATHAVQVQGTTCLVSLAGEIDMSNADEVLGWVRRATDSAGCSRLTVDLAEVGFLDSAGVRMLVMAHVHAAAEGVPLTVANPAPMVYEVLKLTGVAGSLGLPA